METIMIKSMTGFGRSEISEGQRKISVEMKSVNHRYLEAGIKMPKKLNVFEARIRDVLKQYANRGKIDIFISYEDLTENKIMLKYNSDIAAEYMDIFNKMAEQFDMKNDVTIAGLSRYPEVITMEDIPVDEDELWHFIEKAVRQACEQFVNARITEGENLKKDLLDKLDNMAEVVAFIENRSPKIMKEYRNKLENKVAELLNDTTIDENRIATEVIIYADKICVDEEIIRLLSHIKAMRDSLNSNKAIGRKLDFITQEMNREANTTLSKTSNHEIADVAIELKTEIEKIREQIQNLE